MKKPEFSKVLLFVDYLIMVVLIFLTIKYPEIDFIQLDTVWAAQLGVATTAYYWKTKYDNKIKVPINVIKGLPKSMRDGIDVTQVMVASIQSE